MPLPWGGRSSIASVQAEMALTQLQSDMLRCCRFTGRFETQSVLNGFLDFSGEIDIYAHMPQRPIQDPRLAEAIRRLVEELHPRAIILFGSRARGTNRAESDYDLLVVSEQLLDYDEVYRPVAGRGLRCDIVPCTVGAWQEAHLDAGGVLRDALEDGIVLYGQP